MWWLEGNRNRLPHAGRALCVMCGDNNRNVPRSFLDPRNHSLKKPESEAVVSPFASGGTCQIDPSDTTLGPPRIAFSGQKFAPEVQTYPLPMEDFEQKQGEGGGGHYHAHAGPHRPA